MLNLCIWHKNSGGILLQQTGYRSFETNEIEYLVSLLQYSENQSQVYMSHNLQLEMAFMRYY